MQPNKINIQPGAAIQIPCQGNGVWFESGSSTTSNLYILVKPEGGTEFRLKPGQHVQEPGTMTGTWTIRAEDQAAAITGSIIIGSGEFADNNTLNKVTLDATFANNVTVMNDATKRVPVSLDLTQQIKLDTSTPINVAGTSVQYTNSFCDVSNTIASGVQVFSAAQNPNGAWIEFAEICLLGNAGQSVVSITAKATPSANYTDGDVIFAAVTGSSSQPPVNAQLTQRIKVPAGKGLFVNVSGSSPALAVKNILYTLL